jgi:tetratricopeptide (TPR) repeat protein
MKKKAMSLLTIAVIVLATGNLIAQEGRGRGRVSGMVRDEAGKLIKGAKITMTSAQYSITFDAVTNEKGMWAIIGFSGGLWNITVSAPGYITQNKKMRLSQLSKNPQIDFVLKEGLGGEGAGAVALVPGTKEIFDTALEAYNTGRYEEALAGFGEFLEKNPTLYQTHINIGNCYRKLSKYDEAIMEYEEVLKSEATSAQALTNLGECYANKGDLEKAREYFEKVIAASPNDPIVFYNLGEIYFNANQVDGAIEHYEKALELKPDWSPAVIKLGYAYLNKGDIEKAVSYFKKYLEIDPEGPDAPVAKELLKQFENQPPDK